MTRSTGAFAIAWMAMAVLIAAVSGCLPCRTCDEPEPVVQAPPAKPAPAKVVEGMACASLCDRNASVSLEKCAPRQVRVGVPFTTTIKVANTMAECAVEDVVVTDILQENMQFKDADPKPLAEEGKSLSWALGRLAPKEAKQIQLVCVPAAAGPVGDCATVTYKTPVCLTVQAVEPRLALAKTAPTDVLLCDKIPVKFVVANPGTGPVQNVVISDDLPAGLTTAEGKTRLEIPVGDLAAGQSKEFTVELMAAKAGAYENKAVAASADGLKAEAATKTAVRQPVLEIAKSGPNKVFLGRTATYQITVSNKGDAAAASAIVQDTVPAGMKFVSASDGGQLSAEGVIVWNLGTLDAGATKKVSAILQAESVAAARNTAKIAAQCANPVTAEAITEIVGIPAVLLEVIDIEDPVAVGNNEVYEIRVTNQGTATDSNIKIVCELEENETFVSSEGPTKGVAQGNTIAFDPLPQLASKEAATWRVTVKTVKAGDTRFKCIMTTDQIGRPVQETEATNIYE